ncbi:MAG TPA: hypothetical protein VFA75_06670 [Nevskia sp.]|jgi:hypothetical protein|nr:hypothetical protein [Nevskia sp.]
MSKQLRGSIFAAFVGAGISGVAYADVLPDDLGVNNLTHENLMLAQAGGASAGSGGGGTAAAPKREAAYQAGPLRFTIGGFTELAGIFRSRNETADVASSFNGVPFANAPNYYTSEFRESGRQSRLALLVQGPSDGDNAAEAYFETDFLSAGVTSNSNESNSYTLRVRQAYARWTNRPYGFYVLGGQSWSLATMYKNGLTPRQENVPLTIDGQYVPGFNWTRNAEIRIVKDFGGKLALGLSLENPTNIIKGTAPANTDSGNPGGSLYNSTATYSTDVAPDVVFKVAADPGYGHYELYSLTRFFHDRAPSTPSAVATENNNTTIAESIGGGAILPLLPKMLDFQVSGILGHGNGRYGSGSLADSTYNTGNGAPAALQEEQLLAGLVGHPSSSVDVYLYGGLEHEQSAWGYGVSDNSACNVNYAASPAGKCSGAVATVREITGGFWWKFYKGSLGYLMAGAEGGYLTNATFADTAGNVGHTNDTIAMVSFRYYPFQ